jgi:hypothetical protein
VGDFRGDVNMVWDKTLLKPQKRFVCLIAGKRGLYHADPLFAKYGILKNKMG